MRSKTKIKTESLCQLFGKSRQGYYDNFKRLDKREEKQERLLEKIQTYKRLLPFMGGRKLHKTLEKEGMYIGRDQLFGLLRSYCLLVRRKRKYAVTTQSKHWLKKYPNLIKDMAIQEAERVLVSDITYIATEDGFSYLPLVTDAYSKKIMGYKLSKNLGAEACQQALKQALSNRVYDGEIIHHSDRGIQYCSHDYVNVLKENKASISMTEDSSPYSNAIAERVNGILKSEFGLDHIFKNHQDAEKAVRQAVFKYNNLRPHLSCGYLTPTQAHVKGKELIKIWKPRKKENIINQKL